MEPRYLQSLREGRLRRAAREAFHRLSSCDLCPRCCRVDRRREELGFCRTGLRARVASAGPHFGEEAPLVGVGGSGTIFFSECNLRCSFCQNWEISEGGEGAERGLADLGRLMLDLQRRGCHNLNLVTPSHVVPQILGAVCHAARRGLSIPIVYNTSAYDTVETLRLLDGVVDLYMPDLKWVDREVGERLADAPDYWEVATAAVREMHRQVGDLVLDEDGIARRGLLVRHLVLPGGLAGTPRVLQFLADEVSRGTYVNVMAQYRPAGEAHRHPPLDRRVTRKEHAEAVEAARRAGLTRLDGVSPR
ncbi:MAG: radical SAM protein [Deltaproteobacteria bacterium]|nr:radical SAM protein [Deltaproteobacteria bacterium]